MTFVIADFVGPEEEQTNDVDHGVATAQRLHFIEVVDLKPWINQRAAAYCDSIRFTMQEVK
jgi:hypothetical protein